MSKKITCGLKASLKIYSRNIIVKRGHFLRECFRAPKPKVGQTLYFLQTPKQKLYLTHYGGILLQLVRSLLA